MNRRAFGWSLLGAALAARSGKAFAVAKPGNSPFKFSTMLWQLAKLGPIERLMEMASQAGYAGVELVKEYRKWSPQEMDAMAARARKLSLEFDAMAGVAPGFAEPGTADALLTELRSAVEAGKRFGCRRIILMSGKRLEGVAQHETAIETLKRAAEIAEKENVELLIEPIDTIENPTMYLNSVVEGFSIAKAVASRNVKVLYDFYHEQRQTGNLLEKLDGNVDLIGLVHIASVPGRNDPSVGEIRYENVYRRLREVGYNGWVAMEYRPLVELVPSLKKAREEAEKSAVSR